MNPILLRNDGPIENDIKPYYLDGKDIKTALEDINKMDPVKRTQEKTRFIS